MHKYSILLEIQLFICYNTEKLFCEVTVLAGFRSSFFGFNKEDVMNYIKSSKEENNKKINALNTQLNNTNKKNDELTSLNEELKSKIAEFTAKQDEIERLSQSIAKMHIIASANAKSVIEKSAENMALSQQQVDSNIKCADDAAAALADIRSKLTECCGEFCNKIDTLTFSLDEIKSNIDENSRDSQNKINSFIETFNKIDNT